MNRELKSIKEAIEVLAYKFDELSNRVDNLQAVQENTELATNPDHHCKQNLYPDSISTFDIANMVDNNAMNIKNIPESSNNGCGFIMGMPIDKNGIYNGVVCLMDRDGLKYVNNEYNLNPVNIITPMIIGGIDSPSGIYLPIGMTDTEFAHKLVDRVVDIANYYNAHFLADDDE